MLYAPNDVSFVFMLSAGPKFVSNENSDSEGF